MSPHESDGRAPFSEWQCADCQTWYPQGTAYVMTSDTGGQPEMWCTTCRPPKLPALRHLRAGGWTLFGYGGFTEEIKRNAAERRAQGLLGGGAE